ncbi:MAG TPA: hypothetical protein VFG38_19875 [Pseudomonadales bacterium]|nr:hypothetical protein [Pseudomonadales bacterium]
MESRLSELSDDALLREHEKSLKCLRSLDSEVPDWVREIRVMYHHDLINELLERRRLVPSGPLVHS